MADLKPIGSEKLQGMEKIARIMEIARYGETPREEINENQTLNYSRVLADGITYGIVKEKQGYIIKKGINESSLEYAEPMKNRKYHSSYSQALKKLNLIAGELNRLNENEVGTEMFGEQKKILKLPKQAAPAPAPAPVEEPPMPETPAPDMSTSPEAPAPDMGDEMPMDDMGMEEPAIDDMGGEEMDVNVDVEAGDDEVPTFKMIQKLTGKLGQKIRTFSENEEMTSEDVKYVLNSILSALDLSKLTEEDIEDIMSKIEGEEEESNYDMDVAMEPSDSEEPLDLGDEMGSDEVTVEPEVGEMTNPSHRVMDEMFNESKVDKILSKYFVITEEEKKENEVKQVNKFIKKKINKVGVLDEVKNLSETIEQELTSEFILRENENAKFLGKTNLKNLVFESEGKQIKVSPRGEIL
jgi:cell division protein ZapA (FtsZ GTPase activity inhibitor)